MVQEIATPLGLRDTKGGTQLDSSEMSRRAQGYTRTGSPGSFAIDSEPACYPSACLYSTLDDMLRYLAYDMGQANTPLNSLRDDLFQWRQASVSGNGVGLDWNIGLLPGTNETFIWKTGSVFSGFVSYIGFVPSHEVGVTLLINTQDFVPDALGQQILKFLLTNPSQELDLVRPHRQLIPIQQIPRGPGPVENRPNMYQK